MDYEKIKTLLAEVKPIIDKNKKQRKKSEEQGDFFNIFSILKVERNEVYTHSAMLCELLNPNGSHGMGNTFLQLFIETKEQIETIDRKLEKGGQIDILIEFEKPKYAIVIENKIDARDQNAQLARYYNSAKGKYKKNFTLFYLTKYGNEPSETAKGKKLKDKTGKENYWTCISYTKNIKTWLNKCMEKCSDSSPVRGTIKQYINLIDKITDQELDMTDNKELIKKIYSNNLVEIASEFEKIWQQKDSLIAEIIANKIKTENPVWKSHNDYCNQTTIFKKIYKNDTMFLFFEPQNCQIGFYCDNKDKGLKSKEKKLLHKILENLEFDSLSKSEPQSGTEGGKDIWYYIEFDYDGKDSIDSTGKRINPPKNAIEENYYNDIYAALTTLEKEYKKEFTN